MRHLLRTVLIALLTLSAAAAAEPQSVTFDLLMNGAVIGKREVSVRYLPPDEARPDEVRIIETWTEIDTRIAGVPFTVRNRSTGHASNGESSFTSSISINGEISEVQGRMLDDGRWQLSAIEDNHLREWQLRRTEANLSSLDLLDPVRSRLFAEGSTVNVLAGETGEVLSGTVTDLGEQLLELSGQSVLTHRWGFDTSEGRFELAWSEEGLLVDASLIIRGQQVQARARQLPTPRSYGEFQMTMEVPEVQEEQL